MQRSWESGTGGLRSGTEMVGGVFLSRPRPYRGCSAWELVSQSNTVVIVPKLVLKKKTTKVGFCYNEWV